MFKVEDTVQQSAQYVAATVQIQKSFADLPRISDIQLGIHVSAQGTCAFLMVEIPI